MHRSVRNQQDHFKLPPSIFTYVKSNKRWDEYTSDFKRRNTKGLTIFFIFVTYAFAKFDFSALKKKINK